MVTSSDRCQPIRKLQHLIQGMSGIQAIGDPFQDSTHTDLHSTIFLPRGDQLGRMCVPALPAACGRWLGGFLHSSAGSPPFSAVIHSSSLQHINRHHLGRSFLRRINAPVVVFRNHTRHFTYYNSLLSIILRTAESISGILFTYYLFQSFIPPELQNHKNTISDKPDRLARLWID